MNTLPARQLIIFAACLVLSPAASAQPDAPFANIESMVQRAIEQGDLPGAVVCFADAKNIRYLRAIGDRRARPERVAMTTDTVFDLASITKPVATATSIAMLCQRGKLHYGDRVAEHLPAFSGHGKENITVRQCLLHTSGLIPDNALSDYEGNDAEQWQRICDLKLRTPPGEAFSYSDVGFIVLGRLVRELSGMPLDRFAAEQIFQPLGMDDTRFNPTPQLAARAAPTEKQGDRWLCGTVHDPRAARMGGVAGHAGLFSTADDLVVYSQHLLAALRGKSDVMKAETVRAMTAAREVPRGTRTLGWDHQSPYSRNRGSELSDAAFGHGGFTGTVLWIDPDKELIFIFLSSRLHPDGKGSVNSLAGQIVSEVAAGWEPSDQ